MADFQPFAGIEYSADAGGDFADLISPPYDVISPSRRAELAAKNPHNIVRIILPEGDGGRDAYAQAAHLVETWLAEGVLVHSERAFYVIEQTFEVSGRTATRTALLGAARLGQWRQRGVYPHEVTLPQPKADRLNLYRATGLQPGPTFSLFEDADGTVGDVMGRVKQARPYHEGQCPEGSHDRVWKITDDDTIGQLVAACAGDKLFIADGHHRYETALAFRDELAAAGPLDEDHPANFVLMALVPFADEGLVMLPTHRLLKLAGSTDVESALTALERDYELVEAGDLEACQSGASAGSIGIYTRGRSFMLAIKEQARRAFVAEAGELMAGINVYEVRHKVLPGFFADVEAAIAEEHITYTHDLREATALVDDETAEAAVILAPLGVRAMAAVAAAGRTMPPKSTYFYPKLPTGIALKPMRAMQREAVSRASGSA